MISILPIHAVYCPVASPSFALLDVSLGYHLNGINIKLKVMREIFFIVEVI